MKDVKKTGPKQILIYVLFAVLLILFLVPFALVLLNSFKPNKEIILSPLALPKEINLQGYVKAFSSMNYVQTFTNSLIITALSIVFIILFAVMCAYFFARNNWKINKIIFSIMVTSMIIPFQTIMITLLKAMNVIHLSGSRLGLGVQYWGFGIPMATFIFYNFMKTIPRELDESAKIDGASTTRTFISVIFPLLKSVTVTVIVLDVMWIWNDFLLPLLMVNSSNKTKTLVLAAYTFIGQMNTKWHYAMTAMVLAVTPSIIIFVLLQKYIVEGVVAGAVKG